MERLVPDFSGERMMARYLAGFLIMACAVAAWFGLQALTPRAGAEADTKSTPATDSEAAQADGESPPPGPRPRAEVDEPTHEFGTMRVGEQRSHVFVIRNTGDAPLLLGEPDSTCKCTIGKLAGDTVPPGGSVEVTLTWRGEKVAREFREWAEISTNDPDRERLRLVIAGRVEPLFVVSPTFHWHAGDFADDEPKTVTGTVHSTVLDSFALVKVESSHPLFTPRIEPLDEARREKLGATAGYAVEVTIDPAVPEGTAESVLTIHTDVEGLAPAEVRVTAQRVGPIRFLAAPGVRWDGIGRAIDLGRFAAADGRSALLHLFATDPADAPFRVTQIETDPPFLKADLVQDKGFHASGRQRFALTVSVPPGSPPAVRLQDGCATVRLHTNHPRAKVAEVYVEFRSF